MNTSLVVSFYILLYLTFVCMVSRTTSLVAGIRVWKVVQPSVVCGLDPQQGLQWQ